MKYSNDKNKVEENNFRFLTYAQCDIMWITGFQYPSELYLQG